MLRCPVHLGINEAVFRNSYGSRNLQTEFLKEGLRRCTTQLGLDSILRGGWLPKIANIQLAKPNRKTKVKQFLKQRGKHNEQI